ncbi:MAG: hypothetical protein ACYDA9_03140 [Terriglobia bacterium]
MLKTERAGPILRLLLLALVVAVPLAMAPLSALADTINLGAADQGAFFGEPNPGTLTFTGNGAGGFSSVSWNGWIGTASGPGADSGFYSVQGGSFTAGTAVLDQTILAGGLESWNLSDLGGNTFFYNDTLANLGTNTGAFLLANLVFGTLSGGPSMYTVQGSLASFGGSLAPASGNLAVLLDLNTNGVDLSGLANGATTSATISTGEATVPELSSSYLLGFAFLGIGLFRKRLLA